MKWTARATKERHDAKQQLMSELTARVQEMSLTDLEIVLAFVRTL